MAFASLNLSERYRPWVESGLQYVLRSESASSVAAGQRAGANISASQQHESLHAAESPSTASISQRELHQDQQHAPSLQHPPASPASLPQDYPQQVPQSSADNPWPHPWDCYIEKLPLSPRCIWTYWELGLDMAGRSSGIRRTVLQKLLLKLNLPAGSIGFWPAAALQQDELMYDAELFLRGLAHAGASDILCFGPELYGRLFPGEVYAPGPREAHGYTFHFLPPIREYLADNRAALEALLQRVRHALCIES
ncbi:hypothetical protein [Oceanidesulfovibrio indonesiensis]|nr:hypothetical protein [Oceanidesulfovibrio indonesiensis]